MYLYIIYICVCIYIYIIIIIVIIVIIIITIYIYIHIHTHIYIYTIYTHMIIFALPGLRAAWEAEQLFDKVKEQKEALDREAHDFTRERILSPASDGANQP